MKADVDNMVNSAENKGKSKVAFIFGIFMVAVYWGMGCLFLFTPLFWQFSPMIRNLIGLLLILYGLFRGYRVIKLK